MLLFWSCSPITLNLNFLHRKKQKEIIEKMQTKEIWKSMKRKVRPIRYNKMFVKGIEGGYEATMKPRQVSVFSLIEFISGHFRIINHIHLGQINSGSLVRHRN